MFEIDKMLTLSISHISQETDKLLEKEPETNQLQLSVYPKIANGDVYGHFIYVDPKFPVDENVPKDLSDCLCLAKDLDCTMLCFDADGPELPYLQTYDWLD